MRSDLAECKCAESKVEDNIADLGTKPLSKAVIAKHCTAMGYVNMSQEDAQMGHQSWGCPKTLDQCAASDHVQKAGGSEPQQRKHPQQRQQADQELRPTATSGSRSQNMMRTRGQDGYELEDHQTEELKNDCKENAEDSNQGTRLTTSSRLPHRLPVHHHGDRRHHLPVDDMAKGRRGEVRHLPELR